MKRILTGLAFLLLANSANAQTIGPAGGGATTCSGLSDSGTACSANTGTSGHTLGFLDTANTLSANQIVQGATTTSPGWYVQLTGDTVPRIRVGLSAADIASLGFGSGSTTRDLFLERVGAASLRFGSSDSAAPVAQSLSVQNVVTGTMDTAGAPWTFKGSQSTGLAIGGGFLFQTSPAGSTGTTPNALVTALTIAGTGVITTVGTVNIGGNAIVSGNVQAAAGGTVSWNGRVLLSSTTAGVLQHGNSDVDTNAAIVAQTIRTQGTLAGGTSNQAGKNLTVIVSPGKGTGVGGSFVLQTTPAGTTGTTVNAPVTGFSLDSTGLIANPTIISDATRTDASVCEDTTTHGFYSGSGTIGICLGTSSLRYKHDVTRMGPGLKTILALNPITFHLNADHGDPTKLYGGFAAEEVIKTAPGLVSLDSTAQPNTVDLVGMIPIMVKAIQEEQAEIVALKKQIANSHK